MKISENIDWPNFLSRHDLVWTRTPRDEYEGAWLGNGMVGCMLWIEKDELRLQVFRTDVEEHKSFEYGYVGYTRARLQIGSFYFPIIGNAEECNLRLNLHKAMLEGTIGDLHIELFAHAHDSVISCSLTGGDSNAWRWEPAEAKPTRFNLPETEEGVDVYMADYKPDNRIKPWKPNPAVRMEVRSDVTASVQDLDGGAQHAVAWKMQDNMLLVSICKNFPKDHIWFKDNTCSAVDQAFRALEKDFSKDWKQQHFDWWSAYYPKSFLSLPDEQMETIYWTQIYKMGSITRGNYPMTDTAGIWQTPSAWPYITWNLNVQLIYKPYYTSNRFELAESLINSLWTCRENLRANIRPVEWQKDAYWIGLASGSDLDSPANVDQRELTRSGCNLIWTLHCVWLHWKHSQDESIREKFYELLRGAVTYALHLLEERDDGLFHMLETFSPEFGNTTDCTYDLALLRWGLRTLIELSTDAEPKLAKWKDVLERLVPYHVDELGFMIGADTSFNRAHRHFSHLMQIFPLHEENVDADLAEKSISHFYEINHAEYTRTGHWDGFSAYTWTALSLLSSSIGKGNDALRYLNGFAGYDLVRPNSLYGEWGPCMESPMSAVESIHNMLLQSHGGIIRVFPAMPDAWTDAVFHNLSAEGGFDVSAEWKNSKIQWVSIHSRAGEPCRVDALNFTDLDLFVDDIPCAVLNLEAGQTALFTQSDLTPVVEPMASKPSRRNWYGLNENRTLIEAE
jgi:hypothetical protein